MIYIQISTDNTLKWIIKIRSDITSTLKDPRTDLVLLINNWLTSVCLSLALSPVILSYGKRISSGFTYKASEKCAARTHALHAYDSEA